MAAEHGQISVEKFVTLTANILHAGYINRNKAAAKKDFKKLLAGSEIDVGGLTQKETGEKIELALTMDASAFKGVLTFNLFHKVLSSMLQAIARHLKAEKPVQHFTNERTGDQVFFIPGFVEQDGLLNMLVCGSKPTPGKIQMQLLFLDPEQFRKASEDGASGVSSAEKVAETAGVLADELSELSETLGEPDSEQEPEKD